MSEALSKLLKNSTPPSRGETFRNLNGEQGKKDGRSKRATGRVEQLNTRVRTGFRDEIQARADKAGVTVGRLFELMASAYDREQAAKGAGDVAALHVPPHLIKALEEVARAQKMTPTTALEDWLSERMETLGLVKAQSPASQ